MTIRYFNNKKNIVQERFIKFIKVSCLTGEHLSSVIRKELKNLGLNMVNCRGQAYDGAANMSGALKWFKHTF